jgi:hypothetical protein
MSNISQHDHSGMEIVQHLEINFPPIKSPQKFSDISK